VVFAFGMAACVLAAAALLAIPLDLKLRAGTGDEPGGLHVEWLFGRVSRELRAPERGPRSTGPSPWLRDLVAVWNAELQEKIVWLLRGLRRSVHLRELRVWLRFGLDDPADTGVAWAAIAPLTLAARAWPNVELDVAPDFAEPGVRAQSLTAVRVLPLRALPPLVGFGCSPTILRAARTLRARRRSAAARLGEARARRR
jgi:hypothetical protein